MSKNIIALVEKGFNILEAKTLVGIIRYSKKFNIIYIIDSDNNGSTSYDVLGFGKKIPITSSLQNALEECKSNNIVIDSLLLGTAPRGGILPKSWRTIIMDAMKNKLNIINPLHHLFNEDEEFKRISLENSVTLWDVRKQKIPNRVPDFSAHKLKENIILTVGTDCNVGKMTSAIHINNELNNEGYDSVFVPTGQTGILIEGWGTSVDEIICDFAAGVSEELVLTGSKLCKKTKQGFIIVEGQGSLTHPCYSGMTLSLLHGTAPDALILCHQCNRTKIRRCDFSIPSLKEYINIYNSATKYVKPSNVIAICLNTVELTEEEAKKEIERVYKETGLPTTDPIRFNSNIIIDAIKKLKKKGNN